MMKVDPSFLETDVCQTSIDILRDKCAAYLAARVPGEVVWFADDNRPFPGVARDTLVNVVLFGGFLERILESGNWPAERVRFWVPCEATREVLVELLGLSQRNIGLVPRYELFPMAREAAHAFPDAKKPFHFVFAGRISPTKNIAILLRTVALLQTRHQLPVGISLFGEFDAQPHPDRGRRDAEDYRARILRLVEDIEWTRRPDFRGKVGPSEWLRAAPENPVYINFSTFICEDFDVSLAQAQAAGWPAIFTDWGGHREVRGRNVHRIPAAQVGNSHEPEALLELKARNLASRLASFLSCSTKFAAGEFDLGAHNQDELPQALACEELDRTRRACLRKFGPDAQRLVRHGLAAFADTETGQAFFSRYRQVFAGRQNEKPVAVLVNDLHASENPALQGIRAVCVFCLEQANRSGAPVVFVPLRELKRKECAWQLLSASKIIFPFYAESLLPFFRVWLKEFGALPPVEIFVPRTQDLHDENLHAWLRPQDRVIVYDSEPLLRLELRQEDFQQPIDDRFAEAAIQIP